MARRRRAAACRSYNTGAAGAANLSKHRDVLRPGDITTDYASAGFHAAGRRVPRDQAGGLRVITRYVAGPP